MIKLQTKGVGGVKGIFDPKQFSFLIASLVQMDLPDKQTLLELTSTIERMRKLESAIEDINPLLKKLLEKDRIIGMNGHTKHGDEE
jgi:pyruvate-formate lyase